MGYTHYWGFKPAKRGETAKVNKLYRLAIRDCNKVIKAYQSKAIGYERLSGYSAYTDNYGGLKVNGKGDFMHEDFTMREHYRDNKADFCKTARKPYDLIVVACLTILKSRLKDYIDVSSDGQAINWQAGVEYASIVLDKALSNPLEEKT